MAGCIDIECGVIECGYGTAAEKRSDSARAARETVGFPKDKKWSVQCQTKAAR
jgi:hypothetical protein